MDAFDEQLTVDGLGRIKTYERGAQTAGGFTAVTYRRAKPSRGWKDRLRHPCSAMRGVLEGSRPVSFDRACAAISDRRSAR